MINFVICVNSYNFKNPFKKIGIEVDIKLDFVNESNDWRGHDIAIFHKNDVMGMPQYVPAWKVIQKCGPYKHHPFLYSLCCEIGMSDSYGNYTLKCPAINGRLYQAANSGLCNKIAFAGKGSRVGMIEAENIMQKGAVNINIFRNNRVAATRRGLAPGQSALFETKPVIYIGVADGAKEGEMLSSETIKGINTKISLLGIAKAQILMTGGGSGPDASPFRFDLINVVRT